jgi:hypothetical protein
MSREAAAQTAGDVLDERRVGEDQPVAGPLILGLRVFAPEILGLVTGHA